MTHVRSSITRLLLGLFFLALAPVQVARAGMSSGGWTTGYTVDYASGVTHTSSQWTNPGSPASGNTRWSVEGGLPAGTSSGRLPVGKSYIDVQARVLPDRPSLGSAFGKFFRKSLPVISTAYALKDLANELGYIFGEDGSVSKQDPTICTVAPCYEYKITNNSNPGPYHSTQSAACLDFAAQMQVLVPGANWSGAYHSGSTCYTPNAGSAWSYSARSVAPAASDLIPSTIEAIEADIASKTNWPANSKLPAAMKELADSGEPIIAPSPTVTGPSSVSEPVVTTTNPDGTTTTKSVTHNVTYGGNTINYSTTTITNNNGQITTETKSGEPPTDHCERYPDTAGCASLDTPSSDVLEKKTHAVTVDAVSFASSSVCPSPLSFTVRGASYGVSYQPLCDRLAILKALFLALAAVLAAFIVADSFRVT